MLAQKLIAILSLALTVSASPLLTWPISSNGGDGEGNQEIGNEGQNSFNNVDNSGNIHGDFTVKQSIKTCGNAQLNCCNNIEKKGDTTNAGILASLFGSGDVGIQCSAVNAAVIGGKFDPNALAMVK